MATRAKKVADQSQVTDEDRQPGVVYIGHVPHGFHERQLRQYFSQFGSVLAVKLSRSQKTGNSKGYAFIKFRYAAVAKTVAETCHNYLFFNKLLKCEYKPLSEIHADTFHSYKWKPNNKSKRLHNSAKNIDKLEESLQKSARRNQSKLNKLKELGIELKLEDVMNVPEAATRKRKAKTVETEAESNGTDQVSTEDGVEKVSTNKRTKRRLPKKAKTPPAQRKTSVKTGKAKTPSAQRNTGARKRKAKTPPAQSKTGVKTGEAETPPAQSKTGVKTGEAKTPLAQSKTGVKTGKAKTPPAQSKTGVKTGKAQTSPAQSKTSVKTRKAQPPPAKKARKA